MGKYEQNGESVIVELDSEWLTLSLSKPIAGFWDEVAIEREKWEQILPYLPWKPVSALLLRSRYDGDALFECDFDSEWRSIFNLLSIFAEHDTTGFAVALSQCWAANVPSSKRSEGGWSRCRYPIAAQCQVLGLKYRRAVNSPTNRSCEVFSLIEAANNVGGISFHLPIGSVQWHFARTPLGTTCVAEIYREDGEFRIWDFLSDCPTWFPDDVSLDEKRAAVGSLHQLLYVLGVRAAASRERIWTPTGHETMKIVTTIDKWLDDLVT